MAESPPPALTVAGSIPAQLHVDVPVGEHLTPRDLLSDCVDQLRTKHLLWGDRNTDNGKLRALKKGEK